jgi:hypothetical protein
LRIFIIPIYPAFCMKTLIILLLLFFAGEAYSQADTSHVIKVNFLYGSKPKRKFRNTEVRSFGGLHGGHVSIQLGDTDYGFGPTVMPVHIFPKRRRQSVFEARELQGQTRYSSGNKTVMFIIPVSQRQLESLDSMHKAYCKVPPYDYAFFGMRCASATQDILSSTGLVKRKGRLATILTTFYPKRLRKRMLKLAKARGYQVICTEGKATRKWERD